jgi:molybdate transport system regulatory protein
MATTRLSIRIDLASGAQIGPRKIALLEAIHAQGSISGAGRAIGLSYRGTRLWLKEINRALHEPAVAAEAGGRNGGGAVLTPIGTRIVGLYRAIEAHAQAAVDGEIRAIHTLARPGKTPDGAGEV